MPWLLKCLCVFVTLILTGCSSMQLAYVNAPLLAQYQLDRYFDLNDEQEQVLKTELAQLRTWHQSQVLPVYAKTLRAWAQTVSDPQPFTPQMVLEKQQLLQDATWVFAQHAAHALSPVLLTLTERQRQQLAAHFESSNQTYAKEYLRNPQQAHSLRHERFVKNYERWLGPLSEAQQTLLSDWMLEYPNDTQAWAYERRQRQAVLLTLIQQSSRFGSRRQAADALERYFHDLIFTYQTPELQAQQASRQLALATLTADLLNRITPKQRQYLQDELNNYASDFESLAKRATSNT